MRQHPSSLRPLGRRLYRALAGAPLPDEVAAWRGTARDGLPTLRVLHVGDCGLRAMDSSHGFRAPLGFPRAMADELLSHGVGVHFRHYFAVLYEALPDPAALRRTLRLTDDPDVIVVQLGASYARRVILPDTHFVMRFRNDLGRRLGRGTFVLYPAIRPVVRMVGRHATPYPGPHNLERFLTAVAAEWPEAHIVLLQQFARVYPYPTQRPIVERVRADAHGVAERCGVAELDFEDVLGRDPALRAANGYNLNHRGSELVGRKLARWILESPAAASTRDTATAQA